MFVTQKRSEHKEYMLPYMGENPKSVKYLIPTYEMFKETVDLGKKALEAKFRPICSHYYMRIVMCPNVYLKLYLKEDSCKYQKYGSLGYMLQTNGIRISSEKEIDSMDQHTAMLQTAKVATKMIKTHRRANMVGYAFVVTADEHRTSHACDVKTIEGIDFKQFGLEYIP